MKTLAPVWNDSSFTFDFVAGQKGTTTESQPKEVELEVMDYDLVGSATTSSVRSRVPLSL